MFDAGQRKPLERWEIQSDMEEQGNMIASQVGRIEVMCFSVLLYDAETWTTRESDRFRLMEWHLK